MCPQKRCAVRSNRVLQAFRYILFHGGLSAPGSVLGSYHRTRSKPLPANGLKQILKLFLAKYRQLGIVRRQNTQEVRITTRF